MLLRIAVPAGYMPSSLAEGWYLKLCPDGISASVMMALMGQQDHSHHHSHSMDQDGSSEQSFDQCDLGSGFASAALVQAASLALGLLLFVYLVGQLFVATLETRPRLYLARAPPQSPCC